MKMNPPMKRRNYNVEIVVKTRGVSSLWDEPAGSLMTGRVATGVEGKLGIPPNRLGSNSGWSR